MENLSMQDITTIILSIFVIIQVIVRLTPTKKDDEITSFIGKILNLIFNKTNIDGEIEEKTEKKILNDVIEELSEKDPSSVSRVIDKVKEKVIFDAIEGNRIVPEKLKSIAHKEVTSRLKTFVQSRVESMRPRTRIGRIFQNTFRM